MLLSIVCVVAEVFCFCWWNIVYKCIFLPFVMCVHDFSHGNFDIYDVYLNWISYIHSHVDIPLNCIHSLMHSRTRRCFNLSIRVDGRFILRMIHCRSLLPRSHWESKQGTLLLEVKSPLDCGTAISGVRGAKLMYMRISFPLWDDQMHYNCSLSSNIFGCFESRPRWQYIIQLKITQKSVHK